jgi:hypothetical protein
MARQIQFSLAAMLLAVTVFAVPLAVVAREPAWQTGLALVFLVMAIPAVLVAAALYTRGLWRLFCIGAMIPAFMILFSFSIWMYAVFDQGPDAVELHTYREATIEISKKLRLPLAFIWLSMPLIGALSSLTAWLVSGRPHDRAVDDQAV